MGTSVLRHANAMPAPTWHRLRANDVDIELPACQGEGTATLSVQGAAVAPDDAFDAALAGLQARVDDARAALPDDARAVLRAADGTADPHDLDVPALSAYERRAVAEEVANDVAAAFECGLGPDADAWLARAACRRVVLGVVDGVPADVSLRLVGRDGQAAVADVDLVVAPGATARLSVGYDSPEGGSGVAACRLRVFAGAGARVSVEVLQTLDAGWLALDSSGYVLDEGARVDVAHRVLGAGRSYTGLACDLRGDGSDIGIQTRYVGHGANVVDFNYVVRHRGRASTCDLAANGVLMGTSKKVLRGTIDLVHGCKGSEGSERETVLLADEGVENTTVPVILCDEDDVAGNHGATIGHVRPEQMTYLQTRGLSRRAAEGLFATAALEDTYLHVDDDARPGVVRMAQALGVPFAVAEEA